VLEDKGTWNKKAKYDVQDYYTWINDEATTVWVLALPHNLTTDAQFQEAVDELMASPAKSYLPSGVLYPPEIRNEVKVNGEIAKVGYDQEQAKIIVGYQWEFRDDTGQACGSPFLALFPHHRKFMRQRDLKCFLMDTSAKDLKGNPGQSISIALSKERCGFTREANLFVNSKPMVFYRSRIRFGPCIRATRNPIKPCEHGSGTKNPSRAPHIAIPSPGTISSTAARKRTRI
jgi:hypothetical protein